MQYQVAEPGEDLLETGLDYIPQVLLLGVPVALPEVIWGVLDEAGHHSLARWRHVRVDVRLDTGVDIRTGAVPAVLGVVEGALEVVEARPDVDEPPVVIGAAVEPGEGGVGVEGEVDLG
jgi:hypothetical protein